MASAIESLFQYDAADIATAMTSATTSAVQPKPSTHCTASPMSTTKTTKPATRSADRRLLEEIWSNTKERYEKETLTGPRDVSSASKYSRSWKRSAPATITAGNDWIFVL